ncbi:hypothetical protein KAR91_26840 [Candidatus Pacearchaeota archaeon]|nr:hypothetical protein [Candidatus Pacearchaeota archaeon]
MIFGKAIDDVVEANRIKLKSLYCKTFRAFAWFPVILVTGKYVWLEKYSYRYDIDRNICSDTYYGEYTFWTGRLIKKRFMPW